MISKQFYGTLPSQSGVYFFYNEDEKLIYIGKAKNLKRRVSSYFIKTNLSEKTKLLVSETEFVDFRITESENEALLLEQNFINSLKPKYNIQLKDDKSFTLIGFTEEKFPAMIIVRQKDNFKGQIFGPFVSKQMTNRLFEFIEETFKIRSCRKKITRLSRPCLLYHINKCSAPCAGFIDEATYKTFLKKAISFLKGEYSYLLKEIQKNIENFSEILEFEKANQLKQEYNLVKEFSQKFSYSWKNEGCYDFLAFFLRDQSGFITLLRIKDGIKTLSVNKYFNYVEEKDDLNSVIISAIVGIYEDIKPAQNIYIPSDKFSHILKQLISEISDENIDIAISCYKTKQERKIYSMLLYQLAELFKQTFKIALYKEQKNLKNLQQLLNLPRIPLRIDGFDISNMSSSYIVGSSVSFYNGNPDKSHYRRYTLKSVHSQDDYAAIEEVVIRKVLEYKNRKENFPDLLLIDGGKGHVNRISRMLKEDLKINIPLIGLAKREETIIVEKEAKELNLPLSDDSLRLLIQIRDEAHRFANKYRVIKMDKAYFEN